MTVSSLMICWFIVKSLIILWSWILQHLLYCTDTLGLDSFPNLLSNFTSIKIYSVNDLSVLMCCTISTDSNCHKNPPVHKVHFNLDNFPWFFWLVVLCLHRLRPTFHLKVGESNNFSKHSNSIKQFLLFWETSVTCLCVSL